MLLEELQAIAPGFDYASSTNTEGVQQKEALKASQGEKGLMAKGPAIMLTVTPYLSIVVIHLDIMSGFEYVARCNSMA
jgi:hypothetical protein